MILLYEVNSDTLSTKLAFASESSKTLLDGYAFVNNFTKQNYCEITISKSQEVGKLYVCVINNGKRNMLFYHFDYAKIVEEIEIFKSTGKFITHLTV